MHDFSALVVPNSVKSEFRGHNANVKCVQFVGDNGTRVISGSSDNTCRIWKSETGECLGVLNGMFFISLFCIELLQIGHSSRIWGVSSTSDGNYVASGSGDNTIKVDFIFININQKRSGMYEEHRTLVFQPFEEMRAMSILFSITQQEST